MLGSPKSESPFGASVGGQNETLLKIKDDADSKSTSSLSCVISQLPTLIFNLAASFKKVFFFFSLINLHSFLFPQNNVRYSLWNMLKKMFYLLLKCLFDIFPEPIIMFGETKFSVNEPKENGQVSVLKIPVLRVGDPSKVSIVRVHTKDGSATSGEDYHPISEGRNQNTRLYVDRLSSSLPLNVCLFLA